MTGRSGEVVYKICKAAEWREAEAAGAYTGSVDDVRDGLIHLSTADQLGGTAAKHFAGQDGLLLVAFTAGALAATLRWEPSRGGVLFPHVYGSLRPADALWTRALALGPDGIPKLPEDLSR